MRSARSTSAKLRSPLSPRGAPTRDPSLSLSPIPTTMTPLRASPSLTPTPRVTPILKSPSRSLSLVRRNLSPMRARASLSRMKTRMSPRRKSLSLMRTKSSMSLRTRGSSSRLLRRMSSLPTFLRLPSISAMVAVTCAATQSGEATRRRLADVTTAKDVSREEARSMVVVVVAVVAAVAAAAMVVVMAVTTEEVGTSSGALASELSSSWLWSQPSPLSSRSSFALSAATTRLSSLEPAPAP